MYTADDMRIVNQCWARIRTVKEYDDVSSRFYVHQTRLRVLEPRIDLIPQPDDGDSQALARLLDQTEPEIL